MGEVIRFQFRKGSEVRFLSHLDLVRTMERAARRAKLPMAYSEGFTPRPMMSFGFALPVGVISEAEYGDFVFSERMDVEEFITRYNRHLPLGIEVLYAEHLGDGTPALMSEITAASWRLCLAQRSADEIRERWAWLQGVDSFVVRRETKKGSREVDVRPFLFAVPEILPSPTGATVHCLCGLGHEANLRMEELGALLGFAHLEATITRTGQFRKVGDLYRPPVGNRG